MNAVPATAAEIAALAGAHGLAIDPATLTVTEAGLDFRVAIGRAEDGRDWVVRIPRRPDAARRAQVEAALLEFLGPRLSVAVPRWLVFSRELIAYPALPGEPGLTYDAATGAVRWRLDPASASYAASFGRLAAELHAIPVTDAAAVGVPMHEPADVRERWRRDIATVRAEFDVDEQLVDRWRHWLAEDSYWPDRSVLTHGEPYPAHVLVDADDRITGVLDWTTAEVGDPARDLCFQHTLAPQPVFDTTVEAYVAAGGRVWPRLSEHCGHLWSTAPVSLALFALQTGDEQHLATARAQLAGAGQ